jgi:acyl-CoA thioester hydrolase
VTEEAAVVVPFTEFSCGVPEWAIDYNGHMNDSAYAKVLTDANEAFLDALGLSEAYRERTGCSMYTVEITLKFLHEVSHDDVVTTLLVGETPVAKGESLYLHVDTTAGKVTAFPPDRVAVLEQATAHDAESA